MDLHVAQDSELHSQVQSPEKEGVAQGGGPDGTDVVSPLCVLRGSEGSTRPRMLPLTELSCARDGPTALGYWAV